MDGCQKGEQVTHFSLKKLEMYTAIIWFTSTQLT